MTRASAQKRDPRSPSAENNKPSRALAAGTILEGRYQIKKVVGRGGMSTVYAARDLRFAQVERVTAIKETDEEVEDLTEVPG